MRAYTKKLLKLGVLPISPNVFYYWWYAQQPRKFWLESTEILARRCDIMFLIPGWKESTGAREENLSALRRHQPVYEDLGKVAEYVAKHTWPSL